MHRFMLNLGLAIVWMALTASVTEWNFLAGFFVGAMIISVYSRAVGDTPYLGRGALLMRCLGKYFMMMFHANFQVAWEVLTPKMHQSPRIIRYPVGDLSDAHRTALASAITLTPGTLVIDVSPGDSWLYVHCMYAKDRDKAIRELDEVAALVEQGLFA